MNWHDQKIRFLSLMRKAVASFHANDLTTIVHICGQIEQLACDVTKNVGEERELMDDLVQDADSFLTSQAQLLKDRGDLEIALIIYRAIEHIRRVSNNSNLVMNLAIQSRLLTRVSRPKEAVEKAQEALALTKGNDAIALEMKRIIAAEGKKPSYGLFGE